MVNKPFDILRSCTAGVYDKSGVELAYLCSSDGKSLKTALFYERTGKMPLGAFENASCTWVFKGLLGFSAIGIIVRKSLNIRPVGTL